MRQYLRQGDTVARLVFELPGGPAILSSDVTVEVFDSTATSIAAALPCTHNGITNTLTAGVDRNALTVAPGTLAGVYRGQYYYLGSRLGGSLERVQVLTTASGVCELVERTQYPHITGAGFRAAQLLCAMPVGVYGTIGEYRAVVSFKYSSASDPETLEVMFEVVRSPFSLAISSADLGVVIPRNIRAGAGRWLDEDIIELARDRIMLDLMRQQMKPHLVIDNMHFRTAGTLAAALVMIDRAAMTDPALQPMADVVRKRYSDEFDALLRSKGAWYDADGDAILDEGEEDVGAFPYYHERLPNV